MSEIKLISEFAKKHIPKIYNLIGENESFWKKLQSKFEKKIDLAKVDDVTEVSIPILLGQAELQNQIALSFLSFIDETCADISTKIPQNLNNKYVSSLRTMVSEFDPVTPENPNPCYLNWFAEMLAIQKLISDENYEIEDFESPMENGKSADFLLVDKNGSKLHIDVVNIHIKPDTPELINKQLETKILKKVKSKYANVPSNGKYILPVLWFDDELIHNVLNAIRSIDLASQNVIPPCTLCINPDDFLKSFLSTVESRIPN
ncbi:MAG: hypothetical protein MK078_15470 [Crocinitomicaceae bacterium]|nr:hypothetical protein [Crocinitomicaceae bacterium]